MDPDHELHLSHVRADGSVTMVDVGAKAVTAREAVARATVRLSAVAMDLLVRQAMPKGDVLTTAKIAGIMAAKATASLIPMTHPLQLSMIDVSFEVSIDPPTITVESLVRCVGQTGVEIEAMTACSIAALTIYDMCKAVDKAIVIDDLHLVSKRGGKSGEYSVER